MGNAAIGFVQRINGEREAVWVQGPNHGVARESVFAALAYALEFGDEDQPVREVVPAVVQELGEYFTGVPFATDQVDVTRELPVYVDHTLHIVDFDRKVISLVSPYDYRGTEDYDSIVDFDFTEYKNRYAWFQVQGQRFYPR